MLERDTGKGVHACEEIQPLTNIRGFLQQTRFTVFNPIARTRFGNARPVAVSQRGRFTACVTTHPGESQDSTIDDVFFCAFRASTTTSHRRTGPSAMRATSPVVAPYEPPRFASRGTSTDTPYPVSPSR